MYIYLYYLIYYAIVTSGDMKWVPIEDQSQLVSIYYNKKFIISFFLFFILHISLLVLSAWY